jgi:hypothetical protein
MVLSLDTDIIIFSLKRRANKIVRGTPPPERGPLSEEEDISD